MRKPDQVRAGAVPRGPAAALAELVRPYVRRAILRLFPQWWAPYFVESWKYPSWSVPAPPSSEALAKVLPPGRQPDLLFLPMTDWHVRTQRTQQLAKAFAAGGHRCFYLNPHLGYERGHPYLFDSGTRVSLLESRIAEVHVRLPREHVFYRRLLSDAETGRVVTALQHVFESTLASNIVQIVSLPVWMNAARRLRESHGWAIIYDCQDFLPGFERIPREVTGHEWECFETADLISVSSQRLMDPMTSGCPHWAPRMVLVRNAGALCGSEMPCRRYPHRTRRTTIGYVGALDHWLDVRMVEAAARAFTHCQFLLVGRVEDRRILGLKGLPNVRFVGEVAHADLPSYYARFDAAMIPFVLNELTEAANPIKLYEYFAWGIPVVSSALPEVQMFGDLVYTANTPADFVEGLRCALEETDLSLAERRVAIAQQETWEVRSEQLLLAWRGVVEKRADWTDR